MGGKVQDKILKKMSPQPTGQHGWQSPKAKLNNGLSLEKWTVSPKVNSAIWEPQNCNKKWPMFLWEYFCECRNIDIDLIVMLFAISLFKNTRDLLFTASNLQRPAVPSVGTKPCSRQGNAGWMLWKKRTPSCPCWPRLIDIWLKIPFSCLLEQASFCELTHKPTHSLTNPHRSRMMQG